MLSESWDMIIAFPPCTHLATSGARWFKEKQKDGRQQEGIDFFLKFTNLDCKKVVIENPVGIMSTHFRKPDQIVQPYQFGDPFTKTTCLWLKGVPPLVPTNIVDKGSRTVYSSGKSLPSWYTNIPPSERAKVRSKTFPGIALALATQYISFIDSRLSVDEWVNFDISRKNYMLNKYISLIKKDIPCAEKQKYRDKIWG